MNLDASNFIRRAPRSISGVFILLAVSLQLSLAIYWSQVLHPKLRSEAEADSKLIAESQSPQLVDALYELLENDEIAPLEDALDRLMLYREPSSGTPFFSAISLELDNDTFGDIEEIERGQPNCASCFNVDVALYSSDSFVLMGIAHFKVSDTFFQKLATDIRNQLFIQGGITLLLLLLAWLTAVLLIRSLQKETSRREASEIALSENQKKYHRLISNLSQYFVYTRNTDGDITFISDTVEKLYGYTPSDMQDLQTLLTPNPINNIAKRYLKAPSRNTPQLEFEIEILNANGESRWILMSEISLFDNDEQFIGVEGLARDITKQKQIEADLVDAKEQAEIANKAKGLFLANMSHEIRTPMNAIVGNIYLMQKTSLSVRQKQFAKRIESSSQVLLQLVNDILDISKIEAGKLELENIEFSLSDVFDNLSNVVVSQAQKKQLDVIYDIASNTPRNLVGDPLRLNQILLNLVNNAIKFTDHGEIMVQVDLLELTESSALLKFLVKDEGIGISESKQSQLFKSFNQVDNSITRKFGGTGLGLAICQHLVSLMGGSIGVESEFGNGSTFFFTIELDLGEPTSDAEKELHTDLNALIIDDSLNATRVLQNMLTVMGIETTVAHSGEYGVELANLQKPGFDLIFIDYNMPNLNGVQTAERIKNQLSSPSPTLILVTACDLEQLDKAQIDNLFNEVVTKPFTQSAIQDVIATTGLIEQQLPDDSQLPDPESLRGNKVLLVEDNVINQEVAIALLEDIHVETVLAVNGQQALEKLTEQTFNLILMDVQMPVMDGLTATRKIKQELKIDTPIIAMTANAMEEDRKQAANAGMQDFITKPLDVAAFYETLNRWLETSAPITTSSSTAQNSDLPKIEEIDMQEALKRVGNKSGLLLALLNEFVSSYENFIDELQQANEKKDKTQLLSILHKLKGESGNISAKKIHEKARTLEAHIKEDHLLNNLQIQEFALLLNTTLESISSALKAHNQGLSEEQVQEVAMLTSSELKQAIANIAMQLEKQELGAVEQGEKLISQFPDWIDQKLKQDFCSYLQQLDFNEALNVLQSIENQIEANS